MMSDYTELEELSLDEQKSVLLSILVELDDFCNKYDINYSLGGGTLIGAVRHKGFIPWDDDIDILMLREDYERFLELYPKDNNEFKLLEMNSSTQYNYPYAKMVRIDTVLIEDINDATPIGVYVDIFPIDNCADKYSDAVKFVKSFSFVRWLNISKSIKLNQKRSVWKNIALILGKVISLPISQRKIAKIISRKGQKYRKQSLKYVGELMIDPYREKEIWERAWFDKYILIEFEGKRFKSIESYDQLLKKTYGDYMQLPPANQRVTHHNHKCYWKTNEKS